ncbi:hypothetical protein Goshw_008004 [Gossypium schwendimanii]|uniref:Uncharacterized protein n=1 Tax=Gossypium schwendimanii TaxID=34291 RepID=A0A7J9MGN9_GOSSC|nr:hypothetical protein [Gossypium schwendimanii]
MDLIEILDKQVDSCLRVSLNKSMSGFIKRLRQIQQNDDGMNKAY